MDTLHLKLFSPIRLTRQRHFQMSNYEAVQIIKDLNANFHEYIITEKIRDITESECIVITHTCSHQPGYKKIVQYDLCIQKELLWFIRTHQMPNLQKMDKPVYQ